MGRTLLSDALDVAVDLALAVDVEVAMWVGHSCPTLLTLRLILLLPLGLEVAVGDADAFDVAVDLALAVGAEVAM